jgi:hypothetical protein
MFRKLDGPQFVATADVLLLNDFFLYLFLATKECLLFVAR